MTERRVLMTGIGFGESPRWHEGRLWFADWMAQEIVAVDLAGQSEVVASVPSAPFSIDWQSDGRMVVISGGDRAVLRQESDGSFTTVADLRDVCDKPWNEIVVDGRGNTYVNSIGFEMMGGEEPAPGVVALVTPGGEVRQVADDVMFPNGMAVTPDDNTLILAESYANCLTAFDIDSDGTLSGRRVWAPTEGDHPDGICIDAAGAVWYADVGNKRCVRVAEGGEVLQTVTLDRGCFACTLGGDDGTTLCIMAMEWGGPEGVGDAAGTGQVVTTAAPSPHAGWP